MRAVIFTALAALAAAAPRPAVTQYDVVDVYTTVWDDGSTPEATAAATTSAKGWWYHGGPAPAAPSPAATVVTYAAPAPSPAAAAPAYSPAAAAGAATPSDYSGAVIAHHNAHRANHSAGDLTWDAGLAATAQTIANSCVYAHNVYAISMLL